MWFRKKQENKKSEIIGLEAFSDLKKEKEEIKICEPMTIAKQRLEGGARDRFADRGIKAYNEHKVKVKNQWINPLQSINSGYGTAQTSYYSYQAVNYYECYSLAQDPLFNKIFNILSKTPFANGGDVVAKFDDEQKETLDKGARRFDIVKKFIKALRSTYVSGGCMLLMDFGQDNYEEPLDLKKMDMRRFKGFIHIDPINLVAVSVNTDRPAAKDYMEPSMWYVVGLGNVHYSHFLKFEDNIPETIMKPLTLYFGMPLTLLIKQDVANSNFASQGLANLINRFRYIYLKTGSENFTTDGAGNFRARLEMMSLIQDNFQVCPLKDTEEVLQLTTSLQGMSEDAEFFYQVIASKTDITLSILLGKGAQGLSGTLEGERKNFYDRIRSEQEMVKPNLIKALGVVYGAMTDGKFYEFTDYVFNPLEQSDERQKAENLRSYSEVAAKLVELGVKNEDVLEWLKDFKDFHLDNVEFDVESEGLDDYTDTPDVLDVENESAKEKKFAYVMREFAEGKLKTPDGKVVTDPEQAKAIAYSESKDL